MSDPSPTVPPGWEVAPWVRMGIVGFVCGLLWWTTHSNFEMVQTQLKTNHDDLASVIQGAREDADKARQHGESAAKVIAVSIDRLTESINAAKGDRSKQMQEILTLLAKIE